MPARLMIDAPPQNYSESAMAMRYPLMAAPPAQISGFVHYHADDDNIKVDRFNGNSVTESMAAGHVIHEDIIEQSRVSPRRGDVVFDADGDPVAVIVDGGRRSTTSVIANRDGIRDTPRPPAVPEVEDFCKPRRLTFT